MMSLQSTMAFWRSNITTWNRFCRTNASNKKSIGKRLKKGKSVFITPSTQILPWSIIWTRIKTLLRKLNMWSSKPSKDHPFRKLKCCHPLLKIMWKRLLRICSLRLIQSPHGRQRGWYSLKREIFLISSFLYSQKVEFWINSGFGMTLKQELASSDKSLKKGLYF